MTTFAGRRFIATDSNGKYLGKWRPVDRIVLLTIRGVKNRRYSLQSEDAKFKVIVTGKTGNIAAFPMTPMGIQLMSSPGDTEIAKFELFASSDAAAPIATRFTKAAIRREIGKFCPVITSPEISATFINGVFAKCFVRAHLKNGEQYDFTLADVLANSTYTYKHLVHLVA